MTRLDGHNTESVSRRPDTDGPEMLLLEPREVPLGGVRGIQVHRLLPQRALPMVGAWCFFDRFDEQALMRVLPHPHTGLQTVTWPLVGDIRHRDSVGSDVTLRPGELNLMTSGRGVSHSEFSIGEEPGPLEGLQFWVALPPEAAAGEAAFETHADLPVFTDGALRATVFLGELGGVRSPATTHTPIVGADARLPDAASATIPLLPGFEYAIAVLSGALRVGDALLTSGPMLYLGLDREHVTVQAEGDARFILLGGEPFAEDLIMWWNFVGRSHDDIVSARDDWEAQAGRFGHVEGHAGARIPAPPLPNVRLTPRRRRRPRAVDPV
ncbi:pirin family protein [Okibacterium fritillariae]|uniref:pirin family protein n=1 Tax=Okibacterium fritillariae TaxID=123320 RepID=UPI0040553ED5